jgi:SAM-dependent methyltransferase
MSTEISHKTVHLKEYDLDAPVETCQVCGQSAHFEVILRLQDAPVVDFLQCGHCFACSVSRMPKDDYLAGFYAKYYQQHDQGVTFRGAARFARHILKAMDVASLRGRARIVDYGGGDGSLACALADTLRERHGVETVEVVIVDYANQQITRDYPVSYCSELTALQGKFNVVIASAVLEHIKKPVDIIRQLFTVLDDGGYFYARTPYSLPMRRLSGNFDLSFPMHLHDMGNLYWDNFLTVYGVSGCRLLVSRPSIVSTDFGSNPVVTLLAYAMKFPARVERLLPNRQGRPLLWPFVGGWEVLIGKSR